jgi:ABC-type transport system involved in multi-copper enzyme maturation permease subunit
VAYLQIGLICILAPVFMAGAIAQEASPRTWEVLLTTPLSALQIVLGNLFGRLFFILALLVSSLPLFALTQYFGGVPGRSIFASYAIAASAALLVGTIAIALSVSRLVGKRAVFAFYIAVVSYLALTIAVDYFIRSSGGGAGAGGKGVTWLTAVNPFLSLQALLDPSGYPRAEPNTLTGLKAWFWESPVKTWCLGSALLSVVLIGLSTFTVRLGGLGSLAGSSSPSAVPVVPAHVRARRGRGGVPAAAGGVDQPDCLARGRGTQQLAGPDHGPLELHRSWRPVGDRADRHVPRGEPCAQGLPARAARDRAR